MKDFFKDFRSFIAKGNVLDLAVALIIGSAFNAIVKSFVNDIITPLISLLFKSDLDKLFVVLRGSVTYVEGEWIPAEGTVLLTYGNFFSEVINFLIIALSIFVAIRAIQRMQGHLDTLKKRIDPEKEVTDN
mgnify:CR=1 FL=1